ncbi:hypothetical protein [Dryocola clanedunensis]
MKWEVVDSIVNPETGMIFSCILTARELKFIIWHKSTRALLPGDQLVTSNLGFFINGKTARLELCNISPFNVTLWSTLFRQSRCPGNAEVKPDRCEYNGVCHVTTCPYGLERTPS